MTKDDYFKYRVQGGDIYVLPIDIFDELFNELVNLQQESKELRKIFDKIENLLNDYEMQNNEVINIYCKEIRNCLKEAE